MKKIIYTICVSLLLAGTVFAGAYTDNGDTTVTDTSTGLMWQQAAESTSRNWQESLDYCNTLSLAGYNDWRLPNVKELASLGDGTPLSPAGVDPSYFQGPTEYYWSSSTYDNQKLFAWCMIDDSGYVTSYGTNKSSNTCEFNGANIFARCVR